MTSTAIDNIATSALNGRLSIREKIGYGLGDAGGTVITCLIMNFLTFFYTDVFGLTPLLSARCLSHCVFLTLFPIR